MSAKLRDSSHDLSPIELIHLRLRAIRSAAEEEISLAQIRSHAVIGDAVWVWRPLHYTRQGVFAVLRKLVRKRLSKIASRLLWSSGRR